MKVEVRSCPCGHFFVGDHGCPECKADRWCTRVILRVKRSLARSVAQSIRAHHGDPAVVKYYQERYS